MFYTGITYSMLSDVLVTLEVKVMLSFGVLFFFFSRILIRSSCQLNMAFLLN